METRLRRYFQGGKKPLGGPASLIQAITTWRFQEDPGDDAEEAVEEDVCLPKGAGLD